MAKDDKKEGDVGYAIVGSLAGGLVGLVLAPHLVPDASKTPESSARDENERTMIRFQNEAAQRQVDSNRALVAGSVGLLGFFLGPMLKSG